MTVVTVTFEIADEVAEKAQARGLLDNAYLADILQSEIERSVTDDEADAAWEAAAMREALGDALGEDGSIDFEKLNARIAPPAPEMTPQEFVDWLNAAPPVEPWGDLDEEEDAAEYVHRMRRESAIRLDE
jgi:hypothetical protein